LSSKIDGQHPTQSHSSSEPKKRVQEPFPTAGAPSGEAADRTAAKIMAFGQPQEYISIGGAPSFGRARDFALGWLLVTGQVQKI
jgi:hypothetical protein